MSAHSKVLSAIIALCNTLLHAEPYSAGILGASNTNKKHKILNIIAINRGVQKHIFNIFFENKKKNKKYI